MDVPLRLFAVLRERAGAERLVERDVPAGLDLAGFKALLEERHPEWGALRHARAVLGTSYVPDATPLEPGVEVALLPPVSGGAPDADLELELGVFELCREPLDPGACQRRVEHPACGGVVVFTGNVRAANRGRPVERLEYEAFDAMTGPEMERIFRRCVEACGDPSDPDAVLRMLCQHRVGEVGVGEPSVVIAVASPHRDRAFRACRFLIDALKESLPIWKKERYPDGEHWVGERS